MKKYLVLRVLVSASSGRVLTEIKKAIAGNRMGQADIYAKVEKYCSQMNPKPSNG